MGFLRAAALSAALIAASFSPSVLKGDGRSVKEIAPPRCSRELSDVGGVPFDCGVSARTPCLTGGVDCPHGGGEEICGVCGGAGHSSGACTACRYCGSPYHAAEGCPSISHRTGAHHSGGHHSSGHHSGGHC